MSEHTRRTVSLIHGDRRFENITAALDTIQDRITLDASGPILVKPNLVSAVIPLAVTHVDAVRAVLTWLRRRTEAPIVVVDGAALSNTWEAFENHGYTDLPQEFPDVRLLDLNTDEAVEVSAYDWRLRKMRLQASRTAFESAFRISVVPPKTHDTVLVTLGLKNMVMGSLVNRLGYQTKSPLEKVSARLWMPAEALFNRLPQAVRTSLLLVTIKELATSILPSSKSSMHQGLPIMHLNLFTLAPFFHPHLSVIDGFEAMEGNGPSDGDPVAWKVALAGTDWLSVDALCADLMGFPLEEVGYLLYSARAGYGVAGTADIDVVGNVAPDAVRRRFKRHVIERAQLRWHSHAVNKELERIGAGCA